MLASAAVVVLAAAGGIALNRQRTEPLIARRVLGSVTERVAEALRATPVDDGPDAPAGMVVIAAGSYPVGCDGDEAVGCLPNDRPSRTMSVKRFAIMRHEVTAAQYAACVSAGTCSAPDDDADCALGDGDQPARCVDWTGALAYCAQHGFRLPTEWEWEVAARGPEAHRFPWGADAPSCERTVMKTADGDGCGSGAPHEAGTKAKDVSWAGVYDLGGNVREWTASDYEGGGKKVNRGGSFIQGDGFMSAYTRDADPVSKARADLGFRCAVDF